MALHRPDPLRPSLRAGFFGSLLLPLLLAGCGGHKGADDSKASSNSVPVETAVVGRAPVDASYAGTATLEAVAEADVVAKTPGVLLQLDAEEGMHVERGQLLARLDDADARAQLEQSRAQMRKADAVYDYAKKSIERKLIPRRDFDQARFDRENQHAAYAEAQLKLSYTRIVAPISGVISRRAVKTGNLIKQNDVLFHIVDMQPLQAVLNVPERELGTLKPGQPVQLSVDALPQKRFEGQVARVAPVVDAGTGTFRVTVQFKGDDGVLRPGMFGRFRIVYDHRRDAITVPRSALVEEDGEVAVYVVEPGKAKPPKRDKPAAGDAVAAEKSVPKTVDVAHRRVIATGYGEGDRIEVVKGLQPGERVITVGRNAVRDGTEVQVLDAPKPASGKTAAKTAEHAP